MSKTRRMYYTKASGEKSMRDIIIVSRPRDNFLCYDVSNLTEDQLKYLEAALAEIEVYRTECMNEFEDVTGIKQNALWRSFKPEGIEWETEDEIQTTK